MSRPSEEIPDHPRAHSVASNHSMVSAHIVLKDLSSVGEARRAGLGLAATLGMSELKSGELAILITEAARNAVIHGSGGQLVISAIPNGLSEKKIDVVTLDQGPGIKDVSQAFQDGYSTAGTPGTGLGAIRRMAVAFDLFSNPKGTALLAQVREADESSISSGKNVLEIGGMAVPIAGEIACGDAIVTAQASNRTMIMVVDGLGHGIEAANAAKEAVRIFQSRVGDTPADILGRVHDALKKTRGAAAAIAEIRPLSGILNYAGVGNISGVVMSSKGNRSLVSHNGTLGHILTRVQEFKVDWPADGILIMHSDGLQSRWDLAGYPGILARAPAVIAGVLLRDFRRQRDDSSVVVVKGCRP